MGKLGGLYKRYKNICEQQKRNASHQIRFYDFWSQEVTDMWFYRFIQSRQLMKDSSKKVCFFSTFGGRDTIGKVSGDVNVFFTGENLKNGRHKLFADHLLSDERLNLALGFERFEDERYIRFPLWLQYMFEPECREEEIIKKCAEMNRPFVGERKKFACHVSSVDELGLRKAMCAQFTTIGRVDCAGKLLHNCDDLWDVYGNDKRSFLANYKFNICPENSNADGYVTEKVFQAVDAGCVPIYWGDYNHPEPKVLNQDAILFWDKEGDNSTLLDFVRRLSESSSLFEDFSSQDRLLPTAAEFVVDKFYRLESALKELLR